MNQIKYCSRCRAQAVVLGLLADMKIFDQMQHTDVVYVGWMIQNGIRSKAYIFGPTRVDGGIIFLTHLAKGKSVRCSAYFLDYLYRDLELKRCCNKQLDELWNLTLKAIAKRNQILSKTTNYFSGITGKVMKIL